MAVLKVLRFPDQRLRHQAQPVESVDDGIRAIVDDMHATMYAETGIGLAAIQVNIQKDIFVADFSEQKNQPLCFINPTIESAEGEQLVEEGCLSLPGYFAKVKRAVKVTVSALDRDGEPFLLKTDGIAAVCAQHEIDHLRGKLFIDHLSSLKRHRLFEEMRATGNSPAKLQARRERWLSRIDRTSPGVVVEQNPPA